MPVSGNFFTAMSSKSNFFIYTIQYTLTCFVPYHHLVLSFKAVFSPTVHPSKVLNDKSRLFSLKDEVISDDYCCK